MKRALITGITGQDGSYLAELLLEKGYEVHGVIRRASSFNTGRIDHLYQDPHINDVRLFLHYGDMADSTNLIKLLYRLAPDEVYHLAAQSHVRVSFDIPEYTADITGVGTVRILEAIREAKLTTRFYQASSSEMYGRARETPQRETTPFHPCRPYAAAKAYAYWMTVKLPRELRDFCLQWYTVQSRISSSGGNLCHAQGCLRRRSHQRRAAGQTLPGQSRRQARLGLCQGIRGGDVAHAAAG